MTLPPASDLIDERRPSSPFSSRTSEIFSDHFHFPDPPATTRPALVETPAPSVFVKPGGGRSARRVPPRGRSNAVVDLEAQSPIRPFVAWPAPVTVQPLAPNGVILLGGRPLQAAAHDNRSSSDDIRLPERKLGRSRSFHHNREDLNVKTSSKDDSSVLNDDSLRVPTPTLRRSSSQRSTRSRSDDEERSRSRRRKSRSMTGLASLAGLDDVAASVPIGKLSLGGQTLDLDEDPVWDADPRQRSRGGEPVGMIRADVVDEANVDWMFARPDNRAPTGLARAHSNSRRRRAKAVEDIDPETDSVFDKDLSQDGSSPSFIDPFSTGQDSARNVHSSEGSTTVIGRDRSRSSPIIPQRSSRRPAINTPNAPSPVIQPLSPNAVTPTSLTIRSTVTALAQQEKEKERSKFSRLFGGSSKGNTVLRKSDRDRDRSLERKFNTPIVQDPAPPLPTVHHDSQAHVEVVDSDGRTVQANADPMYMLRQLRAV
ncbi:hypothetical protein BKA62DRAFT_268953 [Auriculariales sp. MPI-PUGE-AT-0066]|nr:hypothetical protein BKA62DRAFT_268953 [Auriculariales sp. MPI-PUGE-AT-0066]